MSGKKNTLLAFIIFLIMIIMPEILDAQCAMCKAVLENEYTIDGNRKSGGINAGIMFLMGIPYILIGASILYFVKYHTKNSTGE
ncbi:MAG: hypothetical protein ACI9AT_000031 [Ulvibacter sp.]|jgi:hypothetical protein